MINERALLAALKNEWKNAGYTVGRTGERLLLGGHGWTLCCTMPVLPRTERSMLRLTPRATAPIPSASRRRPSARPSPTCTRARRASSTTSAGS